MTHAGLSWVDFLFAAERSSAAFPTGSEAAYKPGTIPAAA